MNRSEISRALAKAIAYKQCGQDRKAEIWAIRLVELLECASVLDRDAIAFFAKHGELVREG